MYALCTSEGYALPTKQYDEALHTILGLGWTQGAGLRKPYLTRNTSFVLTWRRQIAYFMAGIVIGERESKTA